MIFANWDDNKMLWILLPSQQIAMIEDSEGLALIYEDSGASLLIKSEVNAW